MKSTAYLDNSFTVRRPVKKRIVRRTVPSFNIMYLLIPILTLFLISFALKSMSPDYDVKYVEYQMQEGDSLFNVIQNLNESNASYDVRNLMTLAKEKNDISNAGHVIAGYTYEIPVIKE